MLDLPAAQLSLWSGGDSAEDWSVRVSRRARRLAVRVFHSGRVEIVVPPRTAARAVEHFITHHRDWIERRRSEAARLAPPPEPFPPRGIEFAASVESWRLHLAGGGGRVRLSAAAGLISVRGTPASSAELRTRLRDWLITRARDVLAPMLDEAAREMACGYQRLSIRRQRTRWGSCSRSGTISLNCCLLFQPREVVRYLLVHELAHLRHMNHSQRFWQLVGAHCPQYRRLDRELLNGWQHVPSWVFA